MWITKQKLYHDALDPDLLIEQVRCGEGVMRQRQRSIHCADDEHEGAIAICRFHMLRSLFPVPAGVKLARRLFLIFVRIAPTQSKTWKISLRTIASSTRALLERAAAVSNVSSFSRTCDCGISSCRYSCKNDCIV